jgi:hypothetical protein
MSITSFERSREFGRYVKAPLVDNAVRRVCLVKSVV